MKLVPLVLSTSALLLAPDFALAQDSRQATTPSVEITPYVSVGSSAGSGVGGSVRWSVAPKLSIELDTALRQAEVTGLNSSVSLLYDLPSIGRVTPYVAGGVGLEQYGAVAESPVQGLVTVKKTTFTLNAGGGIRVPIDDKWGYRTDARWSNGIGMQAPERWRLYNGVTFRPGGTDHAK